MFVRAEQNAPVTLQVAGRTLAGRMIDVSEGGLRCLLAAVAPIVGGQAVTVELGLNGQPTKLDAEVARCHRVESGHLQLGLAFVGVDERMADRIRAHVFQAQREARARQR